jgi:hypothetical protein
MDIRIKFKEDIFGGVEITLENITEIHYNYKNQDQYSHSVAFESDIDSTGYVYPIDIIEEFEALVKVPTNG